jgi:hypothetical protein
LALLVIELPIFFVPDEAESGEATAAATVAVSDTAAFVATDGTSFIVVVVVWIWITGTVGEATTTAGTELGEVTTAGSPTK